MEEIFIGDGGKDTMRGWGRQSTLSDWVTFHGKSLSLGPSVFLSVNNVRD